MLAQQTFKLLSLLNKHRILPYLITDHALTNIRGLSVYTTVFTVCLLLLVNDSMHGAIGGKTNMSRSDNHHMVSHPYHVASFDKVCCPSL